MYATSAPVKVRSAGISAVSTTSFALVEAFAASTSLRRFTIVCNFSMTCADVNGPPASGTCAVFARCLVVPAINCCARATTVPFVVVLVATIRSLLSKGGLRKNAHAPCVVGAASTAFIKGGREKGGFAVGHVDFLKKGPVVCGPGRSSKSAPHRRPTRSNVGASVSGMRESVGDVGALISHIDALMSDMGAS